MTELSLESLVKVEKSLDAVGYDAVIFITAETHKIKTPSLQAAVQNAVKLDPSLLKGEAVVLPFVDNPAGRLVLASANDIDLDYDDIRVLKTAAIAGVRKALKAGAKKPLLYLEDIEPFSEAGQLLIILGALEALYVPIQVREFDPTKAHPIGNLGIASASFEDVQRFSKLAEVLESGRRVACDIGEADPERMSPIQIEKYINSVFKSGSISVNSISERSVLEREYPLFAAVDRAASRIDRHQGRIVFLEYNPKEGGNVKDTLFLIGKGVTYDTGGADVKIGGAMAGMSRDKCGAAACVGFMKIVDLLQPPNVRVVTGVGLVRNSIGADSYVSDEVITARSGRRVRVTNTDAEGRMVMADILCQLKDQALNSINPHLFTIATLTGHAYLAVGEGYSIVLDNGPAKKINFAQKLQASGDTIGDIFEISTLRREDLNFAKGEAHGDDVKQGNTIPSSRTPRGHQGPAGFLILASGLDAHGSTSKKSLKYSHLDIAASAGEFPHPTTGAPVLALAQTFLLN